MYQKNIFHRILSGCFYYFFLFAIPTVAVGFVAGMLFLDAPLMVYATLDGMPLQNARVEVDSTFQGNTPCRIGVGFYSSTLRVTPPPGVLTTEGPITRQIGLSDDLDPRKEIHVEFHSLQLPRTSGHPQP